MKRNCLAITLNKPHDRRPPTADRRNLARNLFFSGQRSAVSGHRERNLGEVK